MYDRVIIICNSCASFGGNIFISLYYLGEELRKAGKEVVFCFPLKAEEYEWSRMFKDIYFVQFNNENIDNLEQIIEKGSKDSRETILYVHFASWKLVRKLKKLKRKMILHFHNHANYFSGVKRLLKKEICRQVYKNCECICVSEDVAENVKENSNLKEGRIHVVQNGIDFNRLIGESPTFDFNHSDFNILIMGTYNTAYRKGVDFAVRALKLMTEQGIKNIKLNIISNTNIPYELLLEYVSEDFIDRFVSFIPPVNSISNYYEKNQVLLSLSREEGLTCAIPEASWCGAEVIATRCIGQRCNRTPGIIWVSDPGQFSDAEIAREVANNLMSVYLKWTDGYRCQGEELERRKTCIENIYSLDVWVNNIIGILNDLIVGD